MRTICLISIIAVFLGSCRLPCSKSGFTFSVKESYFPETDSIEVKDTLWLTCKIPKNIQDISSQQMVYLSNLDNLGVNLIISDISKYVVKRNAEDSFSHYNSQGRIYSDNYGNKQLQFLETDSTYQLKVGLIASKAGSYILMPS